MATRKKFRRTNRRNNRRTNRRTNRSNNKRTNRSNNKRTNRRTIRKNNNINGGGPFGDFQRAVGLKPSKIEPVSKEMEYLRHLRKPIITRAELDELKKIWEDSSNTSFNLRKEYNALKVNLAKERKKRKNSESDDSESDESEILDLTEDIAEALNKYNEALLLQTEAYVNYDEASKTYTGQERFDVS